MKVKFKEAFKVKEDGSLDFENMTPDEQKKFKEELAAWRKTVKTPEKDRLNENLLTDWRAIPDTYDPETLFTENLKHRSPITLREYTYWEEYGDGYQNRYGDFDDEGIDDDLYEEDDFSDTDEYVDGLDFYDDEPLENEDFYDEGEDFGFDEIPDEDTAPQIGDSIIYPEDDDVEEDVFVESRIREAEEGPYYAVVNYGSIGSPLWAHGPFDTKAEASEKAKSIRHYFSATDRNYYHAWCRVYPKAWVDKLKDKGTLKISESTKHPFQEAVSEPSFKDKIVELIDSTKGLTAKVEEGRNWCSVKVIYKGEKVATFDLDEGMKRSYAPHTLNPSSAGDGKNTFQILDVGPGDDGTSFFRVYKDESRFLKLIKHLYQRVDYYTLKLFYINRKCDIDGVPTPRELNGWHCAQWGTWKFDASTIDKVKACLGVLEVACDLAERNKYLFQEAGRKNKYTSAEVLMYFETKEDRDKAFSIFLDHDEDVYKCDAHYTPAFPGSDEKGAIERALVIYADLYGSYDITQKDVVGKDKAGEDVVVPIKHTKYVGMDEEVNEFVLDMESLVPGKVVDYEYRGIAEDKDNG